MAEASLALSQNFNFINGTNGSSEHGHEKSHKSHKSHKEKKHKEHKEHKHKKEKKHKKDKHKDKSRSKSDKSSHESLSTSAMQVSSDAVKPEPKSPEKPSRASVSPLKSSILQSETVQMKQSVSDEEDNVPLASRKRAHDSDNDDDYAPDVKSSASKKPKKEAVKKEPTNEKKKPVTKPSKGGKADGKAVKAEPTASPDKKKTKKELAKEKEEKEVWKWWEEDRKEDGKKWKFLEHMGPVFAPDYERLPSHVKFLYDGKPMTLSENAEEVAGFYAKMLTHDYTSKDIFNNNFFKDWRKVMTAQEREIIKDLKKCDFTQMNVYYTQKSEERKNRSKEEKLQEKEQNELLVQKYGFCKIDGHKEKIGNFRIEPPGLFRGRGNHPKMGMLKMRIQPEDVIINCSADSKFPEPPKGHKWKEVRHDNQVTWLATWTENIQGQNKYVMLNPASHLKGEKDWQKYEKARALHNIIDSIRENYENDWKSKEMRIRQRAVALYFIDKLALRAGNEKDADEQADTVGCCSLRVEHVKLHDEKDGKECVVEFDFLGKDSIRYQNSVAVEKRVFKNLKLFVENKAPGDDLFDRLNTTILNKYLQELMDGLTAKVFRTYNASRTLQEQLDALTKEEDNVAGKMLSYNRANRAVAVLCNHQRSVPKNFSLQMERLNEKITAKKKECKEAQKAYKEAKQQAKNSKASTVQSNLEKKKKAAERIKEQLRKLEIQATDKDENKEIALGTSKLNYLDPRISVAWCKKYDIPIEKVYNKTQRQKFMWAIDMAGPDFTFIE